MIINNDELSKYDKLYSSVIGLNFILILVSLFLSTSSFFLRVDIILPFIFSNLLLIGSVVFNLMLGYPEKKCHNQCSLCGASHQIWHFIVTIYLFSIYFQVENWENYAP